MNGHPADLWAYALGDLDPPRVAEIDAHLLGCRDCRRRVRDWREALAATVDALTPVAPSAEARKRALAAGRAVLPPPAGSQHRRPRMPVGARWLAPALAFAAVVFAVAGVAFERHAAWRAVESERALVAAWLTRDDVVSTPLPRPEAGSRSPGTIMVARDGTILVVMRGAAPAGQAFQVWGHDPSGPTSLGTLRGTVLRADAARFAEVWVTLERSGGSPAPSTPIGRVPIGS